MKPSEYNEYPGMVSEAGFFNIDVRKEKKIKVPDPTYPESGWDFIAGVSIITVTVVKPEDTVS